MPAKAPQWRLILMRHAKSAWDTGEADIDRPLAPRGKRAAARIGRWLAARPHALDQVLCSPARRALQTLELCLGEPTSPPVRQVREIYAGTRENLLAVLAELSAVRRCVLLIGHNPGLDRLLCWLLPAPPPRTANGKLMTTAAVAVLRLRKPWDQIAQGGAELEALVRPKELSARHL